MEKREKIIVVVAAVAALYGALDFFILSKKNDSTAPAAHSNNSEVMATITTQLSSQSVGGDVLAMIKRIKTPWHEGVFFDSAPDTLFAGVVQQEEKMIILEQFDPNDYNYTGYLEMGSNKIAIINGTDYIIGDTVNGAVLVDITSQSIKITLHGEGFTVDIKPVEESGLTSQHYD